MLIRKIKKFINYYLTFNVKLFQNRSSSLFISFLVIFNNNIYLLLSIYLSNYYISNYEYGYGKSGKSSLEYTFSLSISKATTSSPRISHFYSCTYFHKSLGTPTIYGKGASRYSTMLGIIYEIFVKFHWRGYSKLINVSIKRAFLLLSL